MIGILTCTENNKDNKCGYDTQFVIHETGEMFFSWMPGRLVDEIKSLVDSLIDGVRRDPQLNYTLLLVGLSKLRSNYGYSQEAWENMLFPKETNPPVIQQQRETP